MHASLLLTAWLTIVILPQFRVESASLPYDWLAMVECPAGRECGLPEAPNACKETNLKAQSPINITHSAAVENKTKLYLGMHSYDKDFKDAYVKTTGKGVFEFSVNEKDYTNELGLDGDLGSYRFLQAHFHWDEKDTEGSEHTLNGRQYPLELHMVHVHRDYLDKSKFDFKKMFAETDKEKMKQLVLVLGVLFEISDKENPAYTPMTQELQGLNPDKAAASHMAHNVTLKKPINLKKLFPDDLALYEYFGSLTQFSDCNEIVRWAVLKTTVKISAEQMKTFRDMPDKEAIANFGKRWKVPQELHGRTVTFHSDVSGESKNAPGSAVSQILHGTKSTVAILSALALVTGSFAL